MLKNIFSDFLLMIQFMTRLPININLPCKAENFKRGSIFFPLVGFIVGGLQWLLFSLLIKFLPLNIISILVVLLGVLITGGFHIDGLGDTCDGFFAFKGKDKIIGIMKDSRIGTFACIAIIFDILIKTAAISTLSNSISALVIIVAPVISRACVIFLSCIGKRAKEIGSGNFFIENVGKIEASIALIIAFFIGFLLVGIEIISVLFVFSLISTLFFNLYCNYKIGGLTGDTLGANNELMEFVNLLTYVAIIKIF